MTDDFLEDYTLPETFATMDETGDNQTEARNESALRGGDRRQGERRQSENRREGIRGAWEERRLFDRREREYSMFGKRFDGSDEGETDIRKIPDVAPELLISSAEIEIFREQDEQETQAKADDAPVKTPFFRRKL